MAATGPARGWRESAVVLDGSQGPLVGILTFPDAAPRAALLIVAGQPQTRVGAHRMFTDLARGLAARGVASLRFDVGGWGDSPGEAREFERSDEDIAVAAAALRQAVPPGTRLWLWGLCDGASAAVLALPALRRAGIAPDAICLVNPWVRSDASYAEAMVRTYYAKRLFEPAFWGRLLTGKVPLGNLLAPVRHLLSRGRRGAAAGSPGAPGDAAAPSAPPAASSPSTAAAAPAPAGPDLPALLLAQLLAYRGAVYTVLSGNDLTAGETDALMNRDKRWRKRLDRRDALLRVPGADHTCSDPAHWHTVCEWVARKAGG